MDYLYDNIQMQNRTVFFETKRMNLFGEKLYLEI